MPDAMVPEMPPALYLRLVKKREKVSGFAYYFITPLKSPFKSRRLFRNFLVHNE